MTRGNKVVLAVLVAMTALFVFAIGWAIFSLVTKSDTDSVAVNDQDSSEVETPVAEEPQPTTEQPEATPPTQNKTKQPAKTGGQPVRYYYYYSVESGASASAWSNGSQSHAEAYAW